MGLGSTAKKLQQMVEIAEKLQARLKDLKDRVEGTQEAVNETADRVEAVEDELAEQRAILEAIATETGVDLEQVVPDTDSDGGDGND